MKYSYLQAICALYPSAAVQMNNPDDFLTLNVQNDIVIDKAILEVWILSKNTEEPMILLRKERTKRLTECDWVSLRAISTNTSVPEEWANYMQELRDLPNISTPQLTSTGQLDITSVNWPIPPLF